MIITIQSSTETYSYAPCDALSRNPVCIIIHDSFNSKIIESQNTDEHIQAIKVILKTKLYDKYFRLKDSLYKCH